jgi:hypothetical protein
MDSIASSPSCAACERHRATARRTRWGILCRRLGWVAILLSMAGWLPAMADDNRGADAVSQAEAAYLINFLRYTEWPPGSFASAHAPFEIVVLGPPAVRRAIRGVAAATGIVRHRPVQVSAMRVPHDGELNAEQFEKLRRSHLVYFHASVPSQRRMLDTLRREAVLTVGNGDRFAADGGMFRLMRTGSAIVFEVNSTAIDESGVRVSAKALRLARHDYRLRR